MAKNQIRMPSGMGGLTRFDEEYNSKLQIRPEHVIVLSVLTAGIVLALYLVGGV